MVLNLDGLTNPTPEVACVTTFVTFRHLFVFLDASSWAMLIGCREISDS
jgi:hypothetical protein